MRNDLQRPNAIAASTLRGEDYRVSDPAERVALLTQLPRQRRAVLLHAADGSSLRTTLQDGRRRSRASHSRWPRPSCPRRI
ncbi:MAG: hypothetical protein U1F67_05895 [Rubrivivax sp.]